MEAACRRALALDACSYRSIRSILKTKLDQQPLPGQNTPLVPPVSTGERRTTKRPRAAANPAERS